MMRSEIAEASAKLALEETLRVLKESAVSKRSETVISWINGVAISARRIKMSDLEELTRLVGAAPIYNDSKSLFPRGIRVRLQTRLLREKFKHHTTKFN
jgi:hypothetical protein